MGKYILRLDTTARFLVLNVKFKKIFKADFPVFKIPLVPPLDNRDQRVFIG